MHRPLAGADHNSQERGAINQRWIEQLSFAVEVFDEGGNLLEVLARLHDLDAARAAYGACRRKYPALAQHDQLGAEFAQERSGFRCELSVMSRVFWNRYRGDVHGSED